MTTAPGPWTRYAPSAAAAPSAGPWAKYAGPAPAPAQSSKPVAETAKADEVIPAYFPSFAAAHPTITGAIGKFGDALQGGGRELIGQAQRLASYISPKGGAALQKITGEYATPIPGAAETVGRIGTQVGEFALPGGVERKAAGRIADTLADAPSVIRGVAKLVPAAASAGGITALQGGNPLAGAAAGAAGAGLAARLQRIGEGAAESAAGVTSKMRKFGRTPGRDILDYTGGFRPATVARTAERGIQDADAARAAMADAALPNTIPRAPAENAAGGYADTLENRFHEDPGAARNIHAQVGRFNEQMTPHEAMDLSRAMARHIDFGKMPGVGHPDSADAAIAARYANELELERLLGPKFGELGNREGSLIAIKNAMLRRRLGPGVTQRIAERGAARTGALASSILGAEAAGPAGAVAAPILQELVGMPATRMGGARLADGALAPAFRIAAPAITSMATQPPSPALNLGTIRRTR